jgi:hypothetical protein
MFHWMISPRQLAEMADFESWATTLVTRSPWLGGLAEFVAVDVPDADEAVIAGGDDFAVGREGDGLHAAAVGGPVFDLLAFVHLPGADGAVHGAGGEDVRVGAPGEIHAGGLVLAEDVELTAVFGLPDH